MLFKVLAVVLLVAGIAHVASAATVMDVGQSIPVYVTAAGGHSPYSFSWVTAAGASCPGFSNPGSAASSFTYYPSSATSDCAFTATITDSSRPPQVTTFTTPQLVVNSAPSVTISASSTNINSGQSTTLTADPSGGTSPYSYQWYSDSGCSQTIGGATAQSYSASPTSTTTYCVRITDGATTPAPATSTETIGVSASTVTTTINPTTTIPGGSTATTTISNYIPPAGNGGFSSSWGTSGSGGSQAVFTPTVQTPSPDCKSILNFSSGYHFDIKLPDRSFFINESFVNPGDAGIIVDNNTVYTLTPNIPAVIYTNSSGKYNITLTNISYISIGHPVQLRLCETPTPTTTTTIPPANVIPQVPLNTTTIATTTIVANSISKGPVQPTVAIIGWLKLIIIILIIVIILLAIICLLVIAFYRRKRDEEEGTGGSDFTPYTPKEDYQARERPRARPAYEEPAAPMEEAVATAPYVPPMEEEPAPYMAPEPEPETMRPTTQPETEGYVYFPPPVSTAPAERAAPEPEPEPIQAQPEQQPEPEGYVYFPPPADVVTAAPMGAPAKAPNQLAEEPEEEEDSTLEDSEEEKEFSDGKGKPTDDDAEDDGEEEEPEDGDGSSTDTERRYQPSGATKVTYGADEKESEEKEEAEGEEPSADAEEEKEERPKAAKRPAGRSSRRAKRAADEEEEEELPAAKARKGRGRPKRQKPVPEKDD